jgi:hypothetical protein
VPTAGPGDADLELVEEVAVRDCAWRGRAIDLVLDRYRENRSQFVFTRLKGGREGIFWQTARTVGGVRPGLRVPTRRASGAEALTVLKDTRERYGYRFANQQAVVDAQQLPAGDYGVAVDGGSSPRSSASPSTTSRPARWTRRCRS